MKKIFIFFLLSLICKITFSQITYTFTGNGLWSLMTNWVGNTIPPSPLPSGSVIYISSQPGDSCILDVPQIISQGANLIVMTGANFVISGGIVISNYLPLPSITICNQVWMSKNLDVSTYRNGDIIPQITDPNVWSSLTTGAWCWYKNDSYYGNIYGYGKLYNWYAVNDPRGLAPQGWHVPSDSEWTVLSSCLGGDSVAGGKMKAIGTIEAFNGPWRYPNTGATNSSGFSCLPGGYRFGYGTFNNMEYAGFFWSSTEQFTGLVWFRYLGYAESIFERGVNPKNLGFSVRCLRD